MGKVKYILNSHILGRASKEYADTPTEKLVDEILKMSWELSIRALELDNFDVWKINQTIANLSIAVLKNLNYKLPKEQQEIASKLTFLYL